MKFMMIFELELKVELKFKLIIVFYIGLELIIKEVIIMGIIMI